MIGATRQAKLRGNASTIRRIRIFSIPGWNMRRLQSIYGASEIGSALFRKCVDGRTTRELEEGVSAALAGRVSSPAVGYVGSRSCLAIRPLEAYRRLLNEMMPSAFSHHCRRYSAPSTRIAIVWNFRLNRRGTSDQFSPFRTFFGRYPLGARHQPTDCGSSSGQ